MYQKGRKIRRSKFSKVKYLCILGVSIGLVLILFGLLKNNPTTKIPSLDTTSNADILTTAPAKPESLAPWRLKIPTLDVDATIQKVGLTKNSKMAVASNNTDVAWYKLGPKPGQPGNAVLAGHLNGGPNIPAVFENLSKLKTGDYVYINDSSKQTSLRFQVISTQAYDSTNAPLDKIFGSTQGSHLNLITCNGGWDRNAKEYNKRLVVYTNLVKS